MDLITAATTTLFSAAHVGEIERFKKSAAALDEILGDGIQAIVENIKDGNGRLAIHHAAGGESVDVLKYLIEEMGVDIDVKGGSGETPLCEASIEGRVSAVAYLLKMGANPDIRTNGDMHPLHLATMKGHKDVVILFLSKGIHVDVSNGFGTPLQFACYYGHEDIVKLLLHRNANPNLFFNEVITSLQAAIRSKSWQCVEHLLKAGVDPNGGPDGAKSLPFAAEVGVNQIIKLLVEAGADPNVTDVHGLKPVETAAFHGNRRGVEILFPVTSPIPSYEDWSVDGVMRRADSGMSTLTMICKEKEIFLDMKSRGTSGFQSKKYRLAAYWYTQALGIMRKRDAAVLSNRSLCYVHLNDGKYALEDATECVLARTDWPKAHYRKGVALKLLNRLDEAADAFSNGLKLDPKNKELEAALREVSLARMKSVTIH